MDTETGTPQQNDREQIVKKDLAEANISFTPSPNHVDRSKLQEISDPALRTTVAQLGEWLEMPLIEDNMQTREERSVLKDQLEQKWTEQYGSDEAVSLKSMLSVNRLAGSFDLPRYAFELRDYFPETGDIEAVQDFINYSENVAWVKKENAPEDFGDWPPEKQDEFIDEMNLDASVKYDRLSVDEKKQIANEFEEKVIQVLSVFNIPVHKDS